MSVEAQDPLTGSGILGSSSVAETETETEEKAPTAETTASPIAPAQPVTISPSTPPPPSAELRAEATPIDTASIIPSLESPSISSSPARRRPKPPRRGILKPPPPPAKPTFGNRLRDLAANVVGSNGRILFDADDSGPSSRGSEQGSVAPQSVSAAVGGTLGAIGGRLGYGFSRIVGGIAPVSEGATKVSNGSPVGVGRAALPDIPATENIKQKQPLRRATFVLPSLSIIYPISTQGEPWSAKVIEDRRKVESSHRSLLNATTGSGYWTPHRLGLLYETACKGREERPRVGIVRALEILPPSPRARTIHLILRPTDPTQPTDSIGGPPHALDTPLTRHAAEALADVLTIEWGLADLKLEGGMVEDDASLKTLLHALLVSGTLPNLSLAGSKKIRSSGWRLLAVFLRKARSLRYIDLSDTNWDKRAIDYLGQALTAAAVTATTDKDAGGVEEKEDGDVNGDEEDGEANGHRLANAYGSFIPPAPLLREGEEAEAGKPSAVQTLRMDGCGLRANVLESLALSVRSSDLRNISLRRNRIGPLGAVALALMIRDYPDSALSTLSSLQSRTNGSYTPPHPSSSATVSPNSSLVNLDHSYTHRTRRNQLNTLTDSESPLPPIPLVVSNTTGGITSRTLPEGYRPPPPPKDALHMPRGGTAMQDEGLATSAILADVPGTSTALHRQVRSMDGVERIGRLLTLDLKGNDIRNGVQYISQVLKRNRTLKVLNLSDNRIDPAGLITIAEALKYNSTLETLDLSNNPCCGPNLEGISALRTAFTVNTSLKRLFLADTGITSEGAIALAEFLPETRSLLHLDLTSNPIDTAGILAISSGLKSNTILRCLDLSIPPNNSDLADLSQTILQLCIRNTEIAAESASGRAGDAIWAPIKRSTLVRQAKEADEFRALQERYDVASSVEGMAREYVYQLTPSRLIPSCETTGRDLEKWLNAGKVAKMPGFHAWEPGQLPRQEYLTLYERAKALCERLIEEVQRETDEGTLARMLELNESLSGVLLACRGFTPPPRLLLPSQVIMPGPRSGMGAGTGTGPAASAGIGGNAANVGNVGIGAPPTARHRRHMRGTSLEISSPNFSIGDSDNDSDPEELDVGRLPSTPQPIRSASSSSFTRRVSAGNSNMGGIDRSVSPLAGNANINTNTTSTSSASAPSTPQTQLRSQGTQGNRKPRVKDIRTELDPGQETDAVMAALLEAASSPVERSKAWVEEEGEVFRKSAKLGVADAEAEGNANGGGTSEEGSRMDAAEGLGKVENEEKGEMRDKSGGVNGMVGMVGREGVSGEILRQEILEMNVARSPSRRVFAVNDEDDESNGDQVGEREGRGDDDDAERK